MVKSHTSRPWDLTPAIDLFDHLSTSDTSSSNHEPSHFEPMQPKKEEPILVRHGSSSLGDFTRIWHYLGVDGNTTCQEFDDEAYESASSSCSSCDVFSDPDSLLPSATDDSDTPDTYEAYVRKSREVRWRYEVYKTKYPKQERRSTHQLKNDSEDSTSSLKNGLENPTGQQGLPPKTVHNSPFAADHLFDIQSLNIRRQQTQRQELYNISQMGESGGLELEVETPSRSKPARLFTHAPVADVPGVIHPCFNLTLEEKRTKIANKLYHIGINKNTLFNNPTDLQRFTDPQPIHVFVDYSNIIIGFHQALRFARAIPEGMRTKLLPLSYPSLAFIMERNRPVARRILSGSKQSRTTELPPHFTEAKECGYELNVLDRVWKNKGLNPRKIQRGRGNGQSSGSETPYTNIPVKAFQEQEQGVDEVLHMKLLETLVDFNEPSTIVLATGDGAEAEYSEGFFKNVERALERRWNVELLAWKNGLSHEYRSKSFQQKWRKQFSIILLDDFCEELLAT